MLQYDGVKGKLLFDLINMSDCYLKEKERLKTFANIACILNISKNEIKKK